MKLLFFDCETSGLPPKNAKYDTDFDEFPYIVQLSWWFNGQYFDYIIKPKNYSIPENVALIHGITTEIANKKGVPFEKVIRKFIDHADEAEKVIAHNIFFDSSTIKANVIRYFGIDSNEYALASYGLDKHKRIDTMYKTIKFVGARQENGSGKLPTLEELHLKLFGETFPAHNSLEDVKALKRCYEELVKLGIICI